MTARNDKSEVVSLESNYIRKQARFFFPEHVPEHVFQASASSSEQKYRMQRTISSSVIASNIVTPDVRHHSLS